MIQVEIIKLEQTGDYCSNPKCEHNPKYHVKILGDVYHIKTGSICALIWNDGGAEVYCRDCIDILYHRFKSVLDSNLWSFK